jgi:hypothetical protein
VFDASDPLNCQTQPRLPYIADAEDADRRLAAGESQTFCQTCERYRWADEQCDRFVEGADPWVEDDEEISETLAA